MSIFHLNIDKCIKCGICVNLCPASVLSMTDNGPAGTEKSERFCIGCGHCVASCPQEALDNDKAPLSGQKPLIQYPVLDAETAETFLRSRRSIRRFKKREVSREDMRKLLNVARCAPSASNSQGISYIVVDSEEIRRKLTALTIDWMDQKVQEGDAYARSYGYGLFVKLYRKTGKDLILRDAPSIVVAYAPNDFSMRRDSSCMAMAYMELYATAMGLGSCWMGYMENCARDGYQPLLDLLGIPQDMVVTAVVGVGYPTYRFYRMADRNPLDVKFI